MRIFLAGIMQGSHREAVLHDQDYRPHLARLLAEQLPESVLYDPLADHGESLDYDDATGRRVFVTHNLMCRETDVLLAFVPEASMGTAIEMWEAHRHGRFVVAVSPLEHNWAVRFCANVVYPDLAALETALSGGELKRRILAWQNGAAH